jgi:hypothetical protein
MRTVSQPGEEHQMEAGASDLGNDASVAGDDVHDAGIAGRKLY